MKIILAFVSLLVFLGCGIISLVFGIPERYIDRDVKTDELVGVWEITPKSEETLNAFVKKFPDWSVMVPLKTIALNSDMTCKINFEGKWLNKKNATDEMTCSWQISKRNGYNNKDVPVIKLDLADSDDYIRSYFLFIAEEKGSLILWNTIGDPDDFITEDFIKTPR